MMTRQAVEFKVNDVFAEIARLPAAQKVGLAVLFFAAGVDLGIYFPAVAALLALMALFFAAGWQFGGANASA